MPQSHVSRMWGSGRGEKEEKTNRIGDNDTVYEPPHVKTNKMSLRPAKTQISLGIRPV